MHWATWGKSSLTQRPDWPWRRNSKGDFIRPSVLRWVLMSTAAGRWPWYFSSRGLWSKVSTWETPPFISRWITRLARGAKWGALGTRELPSPVSEACSGPEPSQPA